VYKVEIMMRDCGGDDGDDGGVWEIILCLNYRFYTSTISEKTRRRHDNQAIRQEKNKERTEGE
jgi:hypothetical protein